MNESPVPTPDRETLLDLLRLYDRPGPRYTSYPTAVEFDESYGEAEYLRRLEAADGAPEPLSVYFHLPFCRQRCTFCGCHVVIAKESETPHRYLDLLRKEVDLVAARLPNRRAVNQLHWGGGTPTSYAPAEMRELWTAITGAFDLVDGAEVAIETDPRVTTPEQLALLRELGFNRISMGVQDFTTEVQEAIGRRQGREETVAQFRACREIGFPSINVDLVYGLPRQTVATFRENLRDVAALRPDRVAVYSFAHVPWIRPNQRRIDPETLPDAETKLRLFFEARDAFLRAGYRQIGMDHFAVPEDELAVAQAEARLHRNFMGYTVMPAADQIGFGISAIGDVRGSFAQNAKKLSVYEAALSGDRLPIEKGYVLDRDDEIRRAVILALMCNFRLAHAEIERRFEIRFADYFARELAELEEPRRHGFVRLPDDRIEVTDSGRLFVRNLCMVFDRHLREKSPGGRPVFSRTV
ncbi:MAG: oxygen-independent coproporphyrinogen III oxidase [Candidatus Eisenbacteria bacterium]|nr:oxygen-independent coproporphyrinogen III oxidase [Candidatus Latescibacterota bacterium]MBD3302906.1 oxygen-independent coproporphyrinogen III oxidase [Candidatus Eisenbacteria bacterium]